MPEALNRNVKLIGRYTVLRELRRDRYTAVFLAFDPVLNRELVLKAVQLRPAAGQDATAHDRIEQAFMRQAQAAGRLHHPHIVTVFDAGRFSALGYLALERVDGKLLDEWLAEGFRPGFLHAADIVARVADAIEYAHARGVPHGHLGPARIYLHGAEKSPKVMGFGGWIDSGATGDFELAGTQSLLPYFRDELAPQARQKDVHALGALLFLLLTGTRPDLRALRERRSSESAILELRPTAPLVLAEIAEGALGLSGRPYGTAAQMRNALTTYLWGNRGAQGLPNTATITGMPARLEVVPGGALAPPSAASLRVPLPPRTQRRLPASWWAVVGALLAIGVIVWATHAWSPLPASEAPVHTPPSFEGARVPPQDGTPPGTTSVVVVPLAAAAPPIEPVAAVAISTGAAPAAGRRSAAQTTRFGAGPAEARATAPQGTVIFAVTPWAEVIVNGRSQGTTPPLSQLRLPAGPHTIELRNGKQAPVIVRVDVTADRMADVRHRF